MTKKPLTLSEIDKEIDEKRSLISEISIIYDIKCAELKKLEKDIDNLNTIIQVEKDRHKIEEDKHQNVIYQLKSQIDRSNSELVNLQLREESIRNDLASRIISIDNKEKDIEERENRVSLSENRAYNYSNLSKL